MGFEPTTFSLSKSPLNDLDEADKLPLLYPASATTGNDPDLLFFRKALVPNKLSVALEQLTKIWARSDSNRHSIEGRSFLDFRVYQLHHKPILIRDAFCNPFPHHQWRPSLDDEIKVSLNRNERLFPQLTARVSYLDDKLKKLDSFFRLRLW